MKQIYPQETYVSLDGTTYSWSNISHCFLKDETKEKEEQQWQAKKIENQRDLLKDTNLKKTEDLSEQAISELSKQTVGKMQRAEEVVDLSNQAILTIEREKQISELAKQVSEKIKKETRSSAFTIDGQDYEVKNPNSITEIPEKIQEKIIESYKHGNLMFEIESFFQISNAAIKEILMSNLSFSERYHKECQEYLSYLIQCDLPVAHILPYVPFTKEEMGKIMRDMKQEKQNDDVFATPFTKETPLNSSFATVTKKD